MEASEIILPADQTLLVAEAKILDAEIKELILSFKRNISSLSKCICKMKDKSLWKVLINPGTDREFRTWESYAKNSLGSMSHTKLFELAAIGTLSEGEFALSEATINAIGHTRAAELAGVPPEERARLVTSALESTPEQFAIDLQEAKNRHLPVGEQKEPTILLARNYPISLVRRFKDLEETMRYLDDFPLADKSISFQAQVLAALVAFFEGGNAEELEMARERRKSEERKSIDLRVLEKRMATHASA